jgi:predicted nuclease with TOPRIM domain
MSKVSKLIHDLFIYNCFILKTDINEVLEMDKNKLNEEYQKLSGELSKLQSKINEIRIKQITESPYSYTAQDKETFKRADEIISRMQQIENIIKTNNEK